MFYPLGFLYYLLPTDSAYLYSTILHCMLGAVFMYMFMGSLGCSKAGAFLSGFLFVFNGYFMAHLYAGHLSFVQNYIWIPLIFLFAVRFMETRLLRHAVLGGLILGIQILGGFPQIAFYTILAILLLCFYFACLDIRIRRFSHIFKMSSGTLLLILIGFSLAAVQLLPTYEFTQLSTRAGGVDYGFATMDSLPPKNLLTFLFPLLFGSPRRRDILGKSYHLGILGILRVCGNCNTLGRIFYGKTALKRPDGAFLCSYDPYGPFSGLRAVQSALSFYLSAPGISQFPHPRTDLIPLCLLHGRSGRKSARHPERPRHGLEKGKTGCFCNPLSFTPFGDMVLRIPVKISAIFSRHT